ncbi:MAG: hypothetical protein JSR26_09615, partial [Proteobacteria bacterium]|nr:hypothetical protein [Pseudomonadota bacterium]
MSRQIKIKPIIAAILISNFAALPASVLAGEWDGKSKDVFDFVEMKSAGSVVLSVVDKQFIYGEIASSATFCSMESGFYCFETHAVEFYVP